MGSLDWPTIVGGIVAALGTLTAGSQIPKGYNWLRPQKPTLDSVRESVVQLVRDARAVHIEINPESLKTLRAIAWTTTDRQMEEL